MNLQDKITKSEKIKETIGLMFGIVKVETKYLDLFKDTALTILMFHAIESYDAILSQK